MKTQVIAGFYVAGISVRTNNEIESTGRGKISKIWGQFMQNNPARHITKRVGDEIYAVYTDYASDYTGDYTYLLGYKVNSIHDLPEGVTAALVPEGRYAVVTSEIGPAAQVVQSIWQTIWSLTPAELNGVRAYQTDFELYDHRAAEPDLAQIDVFLGIRDPKY